MFLLAGYGSWDEGTKLIPRNGISSRDYFGYAVSLCYDMALVGDYRSYEKFDVIRDAYIFRRMSGGMEGGSQTCPH